MRLFFCESSTKSASSHKSIRVLLFSTKTPRPPNPPSSLVKRITSVNDPKAPITPVLDKWVGEGKAVCKRMLLSVIGTMRKFNRFHHALQVSQWMTDQRYFNLSSIDVAVRLKLIYNVHGIEHTEKYFNNLSKHFKTPQTYGALLDCYVKAKSVDKAEAIMLEMKKTGCVTSSFPYNWLMELYVHTGQQEKIDILLTEMEEKGILKDKYTLTNQLMGYITASDTEGIEKVIHLVEDPNIHLDWTAYAVIAQGYLKVGLIDKALEVLKKIEKMTKGNRTNMVSDNLLSLYAKAGKKDDVYRIWNLYKSKRRPHSASYSCMISSLDKLDDIEGAEKILEEWDTRHKNDFCGSYDFRVLNQLVSIYCKRQLFEKAEKAVQKATENGRSPYASSWNILAMGYLSDKQMSRGLDMLKRAFLVGRTGWKPSDVTVASCLEYFEVQRDATGAEEFVELLGASGLLTQDVYHRLLRIYIAANKPVSDVLDLMKADGISADEETRKILQERLDSSV